jgi:TPR repeat protein
MKIISIILMLVFFAGCSQSTENYISDVIKSGITKETIQKEIEDQTSSDEYGSRDKEAALYNLAFENGYLDIALKGWVSSNQYTNSQLKYGPKDIFVESVFKETPLLAHFAYAKALRNGNDVPQDDFKSLHHFIIASLLGSQNALHYMHSIYKEYDCSFQVAFVEKLGGDELYATGIGTSYKYEYKLSAEQKINVQKNALLFNDLIHNNAKVDEYLFDENCLIDNEVKKIPLLSGEI